MGRREVARQRERKRERERRFQTLVPSLFSLEKKKKNLQKNHPWKKKKKTQQNKTQHSVTYASNFPDRLRLIKTVHLFPLQVKLKADYVRSIRDLQVGCSVKDSILGGSLRLDAASRTLCYHKSLPLASLLSGGGGGVPSLPAGYSAGGALGIFAGMSYDGLLPVGSRGDAGEAMSLGGGPARPRPPALSMESLRPFLTFRYELGGGGYGGGGTGAVWNGDGLALRHRFRVTKGLGLEVRGSARLPTPRAEVTLGGGGGGYGYGGGGGRGGGRGGPAAEGRLSLGEGGAHLHVEEVNLVFHL